MTKHSILAVFAHPDDEMSVGSLLALYARRGHDVYIVSITSGQLGVRAHAGIPAGRELGAVRAEELRCAAATLGIHEPYLLGFEDQGIATMAAAGQIVPRLRDIVGETRADVIITFGADGLSGHIDHRIAGDLATMAFQEQAPLAYKPRKLYYVLFPEPFFLENPDPLRRNRPFATVSDRFITTEVDCRETLDVAARALECHKTQFTAARMAELQDFHARTMNGRTYLRLAMTARPFPERRERCLLEGL